MATHPGGMVGMVPVDISDGIAAGTDITVQNIGDVPLFVVEGVDSEVGAPILLRGGPDFDSAVYTVGSLPIWAFTRGNNATEVAVAS